MGDPPGSGAEKSKPNVENFDTHEATTPENDSWASDHGESMPSDREPNPFPSPDLTPVDPQMELVYIMPLEEFRSFALTGIFAAPGGRLQFFRYPDVGELGEGNYLAYIDVHKCIAEGIPLYLQKDGAEFSYGVTDNDRMYLPKTFVTKVVDPNTNQVFWPDDPPIKEESLDNDFPPPIDLGFRFADPRDQMHRVGRDAFWRSCLGTS